MKYRVTIILVVGMVVALSTVAVQALDIDLLSSFFTVPSSDKGMIFLGDLKIEPDPQFPGLDPNLKYWAVIKWNPNTFVFDVAHAGIGDVTKKSSEWVSQADWSSAQVVTVVMKEVSSSSFVFDPNQLTFTAGKPYILKIQNPSTNSSHHYFTATDFYKSIALRKAQTVDAEYKAPYLKDLELRAPSQTNNEIEIFFVAVVPGQYNFLCTVPGHAQLGMTGTINVVGNPGANLELEIAGDWERDLDTDARTSGSHAVWGTKQTVSVNMVEGATFAFDNPHLDLTKDQAYVLTIHNPATNASKHYWTATDYYRTLVTRKAEDSQAEIKVPYLNAIELLIGGTTQIYHVPTKVDRYGLLCTVSGHAKLGMTGSVTVK